ncbi:MAG: TetR/AcrR family transcriptional regulator [Nevskiaceae bacterium]|nr:MAG: TetR/AcrR family transcriptional regulator [Nevskiaceae bacterium]
MKRLAAVAARSKRGSAQVAKRVASRTQTERRSSTIAKLVSASTEALIELGYARTSIQEICRRAGVSHGGLFRHFPSRLELMKRVAVEVGDGLLDRYRQQFARLQQHAHDPIRLALELCRGACQSRSHQAWFELMMAARTDAELRAALAPVWASNHADVLALAGQLLPEQRLHPDFPAIVDVMVTLMHGEAVERFVRIDPRVEQRRLAWAQKAVQQGLRDEVRH